MIVSLFDELLSLFESSNKIIYDELIRARHRLRNVYSAREIREYFERNKNEIREKIAIRNHKLFNDDDLCDWIWNDTNEYNKEVIWSWIDRIYDVYCCQ